MSKRTATASAEPPQRPEHLQQFQNEQRKPGTLGKRTPNAQVDTTANGETSDRTPKHQSDGAASGEKGIGAGSASQQAWDDTYTSDKAQEKQLKAGGK